MANSDGPAPQPGLVARWAILALTCGGLFGQFYAFDIPSAVNEQLQVAMAASTGVSHQEYAYLFSMLYSVYSLPNVLLPLLLGIAVDRCGYRVLIAALGLSVFCGQVIFTVGVAHSSWVLMLTGRAMFGLGGESLQVAQQCLLFRWFKGHEVAFALGLNLSVARAGSVLNDVVSPLVVQRWSVLGAALVGGVLCLGSLLCNAASVAVDKHEGEKANLAEARGDEPFVPRDLTQLPKFYWLLVMMCVSVYCGILPFNNIASAFFVETQFSHLQLAEAQRQAGNAMSLLFLSSAIGTPPFGLLIDKVGWRRHFLLLSATLLTLTYASIFVVPATASMLMLGIVYMVFAGALWPAFALTVPQRLLGTAYGLATALQNAGLVVAPLVIGHLQATARKGDFRSVISFLSVFGFVGIFVSTAILFSPDPRGEVLDLPSLEAERRHKLNEHKPLLPQETGARVSKMASVEGVVAA